MRTPMTLRVQWVLVCLLLLTACAPMTPVVTGEILYDVGQQFLATAQFYDQAYKAKAITHEEYQAFAEWAVTYQTTYDTIYKLWLREGNTAAVREALLQLKNELLIYALKARRPL
jgi:hypothetical protein